MPFYLVTIKNRFGEKSHEKVLGPCNMSPNCTDSEGKHHTYLAKASGMEMIFAEALKEGVHVTRVEEVYHAREYEVADVSVRDDAGRRVGFGEETGATGITQYDPGVISGFDAVPLLKREERVYYSSDLHGDDAGTGAGEVPGTHGGEQRLEDRVPEVPTIEGDFRIGPDGGGD